MARSLPLSTDTVIVGSGPSALILSYILHGNVPHYTSIPPHPDPLLHAKLQETTDLLDLDIAHLTEHFEASDFPYSTQALPVNGLLDALVRPNGETYDLEQHPNIVWKHQPEKAIQHIVIGNTPWTGGQWVDNPVHASWDIATLSYAGMLSLPGYSFAEHCRRTTERELPPFVRPSRRQVTEYLRSYPQRVLIHDAIHNGETVSGVTRTQDGFHIRSHDIRCKNIVLASGVFSELIPAPPLLQPLLHLPGPSAQPRFTEIPILVIGSGFSAADVITSCPPDQKILHVYKWAPSTSPSPLRVCHQQAYPEYAGVYRRMKEAVRTSVTTSPRGSRPKLQRSSTSAFDISRDWESNYEGLPNAVIADVKVEGDTAIITITTADKSILQRRIRRLEYVVGRRGSLRYLSKDLCREICGTLDAAETLSSHTLRDKVMENIEVVPHVFAVGSLTGDSLIRFAYGSCASAAGRIMAAHAEAEQGDTVQRANGDVRLSSTLGAHVGLSSEEGRHEHGAKVMSGLDGHPGSAQDLTMSLHQPLDRRKEASAIENNATAEVRVAF